MSTTGPHGDADQLRLPFPSDDPTARLAAQTDGLVALNRTLRFILDLAEGRADPSPDATAELRRSLDVLAPLNLPCRLGHVVRRFRTETPTETGWADLTRELAFAVSLYPGEPIR